MRKFILFFVLLVIFLAFSVFLINAYILQKNYFNNIQDKNIPDPLISDALEKTMPSIYTEYSKDTFDKAGSLKQVLVLYFTSNWCQKCIDQDLINQEIFDELPKEGIVGIRVHILDSQTTTETDALSQKFDITKEQSFVILDKNGVVSFKHTGILEKDQLKQKILEVVNK